MTKIEGWVGCDDARKLWDMAEEAKNIIRERVQRHGIPCDLKPGYFHGAAKARDLDHLRAEIELLSTRYGYRDAHLIERADVGQYVSTSAYYGGLFDAGSGICIRELLPRPGPCRHRCRRPHLRTRPSKRSRRQPPGGADGARLGARALSAGGQRLSRRTRASIRRKVMPVGTYMAATTPMGANRARSDSLRRRGHRHKFVLDYYRLSADHRLLFGGRVSFTAAAAQTEGGHAAIHAGRIAANRRSGA
jgi:gamma-glutamylputrescine oxidase